MSRHISAKTKVEPIIKVSFVYNCFEVTYSLLEKPGFFSKKVLISLLKVFFSRNQINFLVYGQDSKEYRVGRLAQ